MIVREPTFGAATGGSSAFIPFTLPDGRVVSTPVIKSGLEVMARGLEAQGKIDEAAAVRAMDVKNGGIAKAPMPSSDLTTSAGAAPAGKGLGTALAGAGAGFLFGGPIGAAVGGVVGLLLGRK